MHPAKIKVVCMGRRWGKTMMSTAITLAAANAGASVAWFAPNYRNSRPLWRAAERAVGGLPGVDVSRSERTIGFPSGGMLAVYSADNADAARGEAFNLVILDEAARIGEDAWTDAIQPTLADRAGEAILISTPVGRNWFWREWTAARSDGRRAAAWTAPTSANPDPNIRRAAALAREHVSERTYRQEWLAEFVEDGSGVFRNVRGCAAGGMSAGPADNHTYVAGLDWALSSDYTVLTVMDATDKRVAFIDRFNGIEYAMQRQRVKAACDRFGVRVVIAEENAMGKPNNDELRRLGVRARDFTTTNTTKADLIESLASAFERGAIKLPDYAPLLDELEAYESERLPGGSVRYGAPDGMHDDCVMSLALAWSNVSTRQSYGF